MAHAATIGIIGIGTMGLPMAQNLQRRGHAPWVCDVDPRALAAADASALRACSSSAELASRSDLVLVVVVDAAQVEEVLFGDQGVLSAQRPRGAATLAVVLCSTIAPGHTEAFGARLGEAGIGCIDAPISGGPVRAAEGALSMMVAAPDEVFAPREALLRQMASQLHRVSDRVGDGARVKLVNNLLAGINLVAGAEALALGSRLGLDPRMLFDVINASSGASWMFRDRMARALEADYAPRARASILTKDVGLAVDMAAQAGIATALGSQALDVFRATVAAGEGDLDDAAVIRTLCPGF